jgi:hypothetical protein
LKIYLILIVVPIFLQFIFINIAKSVTTDWIYYLIFLLFWLCYLPYFLWLNSVIKYIHEKTKVTYKLKLAYFKISLFLNNLTLFIFVFIIAYVFNFVLIKKENPPMNIISFALFFQSIGVISFIYTGYFISKLNSAKNSNNTDLRKDFFGNIAIYAIPIIALGYIHKYVSNLKLEQ